MCSNAMKHAYLIEAHKVDKTLNSLLCLIDDARNDIFLHLDKKNKSFRVTDLYQLKKSRLFITDRVSISWGGYSQIRAEMTLFETAAKEGIYAYYHLISGQDLPIKTQDEIHTFFDRNQGKEFIHFQYENFTFHKRISYYYFLQDYLDIGRGEYNVILRIFRYLQSGIVFIQKILNIDRSRGISYQKGANWASVTDDFVRCLIANKEWIKQHFKYTFCADEIYKQTITITCNFTDRLYVKEFNNDCKSMVRCIDWKRGSPYTWVKSDLNEILKSDCMFARKFDCDKDNDIIELLVKMLK